MTPPRTSAGEAATRVILSTFRANGLLLAAGDRIASAAALTSARWQVLGAIVLAGRPLTAPQIARRMGLTRQSVHATVQRLVRDGLLELAPNADHRRSQLVELTDHGKVAYAAVDEQQRRWVNQLASGLSDADLRTTAHVLDQLCRSLEATGAENPTRDGGEVE